MTGRAETPGPAAPGLLVAYVTCLSLVLVASLVLAVIDQHDVTLGPLLPWAVLVGLFAVVETSDLSFHGASGRFGISASEAILLPLIVGFPFVGAVGGAIIAITIVRMIRWRSGVLKGIFNVAQYGCATAAAAALYGWLSAGNVLTLRNAGAAVASALVFAFLTHIMTSIAIGMSSGMSIWELSRSVAPPTLINLPTSTMAGLFFAAAYLEARWMVAIFPLPLFALYLGYRAVVKQKQEKDRTLHLYEATRALASSPDLHHAVVGFLTSVARITSSAEARLLLDRGEDFASTSVRDGEVLEVMEPLDGEMEQLLDVVRRTTEPTILLEHDAGPLREALGTVGTHGLMILPLFDERHALVGVLMVIDRQGLDEFTTSDLRLLEALGHELMLSLESHRLFAEVAVERERFRRIFDASKEGILLIDDSSRIRAWNPALEKITGYGEDEVIGRTWSEAIMVRDANQRRVDASTLVAAPPDVEFEVVTKQGPARWISAIAGPVQLVGAAGWVVLIRDRSSEHAAEEAKSDFLSTISHELRTPLTTIKGSLQVLARGSTDVPPGVADQMIDVMRRGADRLERLVMNLLLVSQMESGELGVLPEELRVEDLVREGITRHLRDRSNYEVDLPKRPLSVRADRERLSHALDALLDNAVKHGGSGRISLRVEQDRGFARISISDEGPGIAPADRDRIFERFVRLGDMNTRESQGAGVGLFIARRSVEAMGGTIELDSEPGKGSTFSILIPLAHPVALSEATGA